MKNPIRSILLGAACLLIFAQGQAREPDATFKLWPGEPPGETRASGPERILEGRPRPFYQLENISEPELQAFLPESDRANGTAVLVCPGGGLQRLAYEHEGLEAAQWLNSFGVAAFVLKYRVPAPVQSGLNDAQRAMGLIRGQADRWKIDSDAIGILGFSAGGEIAVWLAVHTEGREYEIIDAFDSVSCRPDFVGLVYPGGLVRFRGGLRETIAERIDGKFPPTFITHAFNDACQNSLLLAVELKRADVPTELHLFQEGGHGFGVRTSGVPVDAWKTRFQEWLSSLGHLDAGFIREFSSQWEASIAEGRTPPSIAAEHPRATLQNAYTAQRRRVRKEMEMAGKKIGGFKGAGAPASAQRALGIDRPLIGVLFEEGRLESNEATIIDLNETGDIAVETEIGYIMGVDFSYEVLTDGQARDLVAGIVPIIELPRVFASDGSPFSARDLVASNIGSARYIMGTKRTRAEIDPDQWQITLKRDGEVLHETSGNTANGGQWRNLRLILNQVIAQGYAIPAGSVVICGALGGVHAGEPGRYEARFGDAETIRFEIRE